MRFPSGPPALSTVAPRIRFTASPETRGKGRPGAVLSGLLDPSKTRAGTNSLKPSSKTKKGTASAVPFAIYQQKIT